ncbi:MMPL family transporter [Nicoliella lavandulae]|uniref:MMPL family transporter n=1 Tax=Nicoliella lavandulae TaxID=3082954 RepID=A0ABU8SLI1_9LACO
MHLLKRISTNWLIVIVLWIVAIFFAITKLPNVTNLITNYGQPQYNNTSQIIKADQLQNNWGRGISGSTSLNVVYNNPQGKITSQQQTKINQAVTNLQKNRSLGIQKISTINNNPNGKLQLFSNDQTTQIVSLNVSKAYNTNGSLVNKLQEQMNVSGLNTYVTSPSIIQNINAQQVAKVTKTVTMIAFVIAIVLMAIYFRSIIAPLVSAITLVVTYITSLSLISNLTVHRNFAFSEFTPLLVTLITIILGSIFNFIIIKAISDEMGQYRDSFSATNSGMRKVMYPIMAVNLVLAISFASLYFTSFYSLRALASLAIVFVILMIATLTLNPIFTSLLGPEIIWPRHNPINVDGHRGWYQLIRLSLWQPLAGIILVAYILGPFAYSYRNNVTYTDLDNAKSTNQAVVGARVLQAHFSQGKATPITIYIHNQQPLNQQSNLEKIDALTTKLKSLNGVDAVYSVTQPSGIPINKYYVQSQLNSITKKIDAAQINLDTTLKQAKVGQKNIDPSGLNSEISTVSELQSTANSLVSENSKLASQLSNATTHSSFGNQKTTSNNIKNYQSELNNLNSTLKSAANGLNSIQSQGQTIADSSDRLSTKISKYAAKLEQAKAIFAEISTVTKAVNSKLNSIYDYLDGLSKSSVGAVYYITPDQLADTDFQQSLYNYNSADNKTTQISVILQGDPTNAQATSKVLNNIQKDVDVMLQGTAIANSEVAITGQPAQQNTLKNQFFKDGLISLALIGLIALLTLFIASRSILHPIYWLAAFSFSVITGLQLTNLTTSFALGIAKTSWSTIIISLSIAGAVAFTELLMIATKYRKRLDPSYDFLAGVMSQFGQIIRYIIAFTIIIAIGMVTVDNQVIKQSGLVIAYTIVIFNIVFPLIAVALNKLAVRLPLHKND